MNFIAFHLMLVAANVRKTFVLGTNKLWVKSLIIYVLLFSLTELAPSVAGTRQTFSTATHHPHKSAPPTLPTATPPPTMAVEAVVMPPLEAESVNEKRSLLKRVEIIGKLFPPGFRRFMDTRLTRCLVWRSNNYAYRPQKAKVNPVMSTSN